MSKPDKVVKYDTCAVGFFGSSVAVKAGDVYVTSKGNQEKISRPTVTVHDYIIDNFRTPVTAISNIADGVQHCPDLLNETRESILQYLVGTVFAPLMHLHHNALQSNAPDLWNPLVPIEGSKYSRVTVDGVDISRLSMRFESAEDGTKVCRIKSKYKRDTEFFEEFFSDGGVITLSNDYDRKIITSSETVSIKLPEQKRDGIVKFDDTSVSFRLFFAGPDDKLAPWANSLALSMVNYLQSPFMSDEQRTVESETIQSILGDGVIKQCNELLYDQKWINSKRASAHKEDSPYTSLNGTSLDFVHPVLSLTTPAIEYIVELRHAKWPERR